MKVSIYPATEKDVSGIFSVEKKCFTLPWSLESIYSDVVSSKITNYFVAKTVEGNIIGFGGMYSIAGETHITNIAVLPTCRKCGIGAMLVSSLINKAQQNESFGITLEVRVSNKPAILTYQKFGFAIEGLRKNYYQDNNEDAYIMWLNFEINKKNM
jgi:[ribosomal protein S18]-alanine N-acetyltransferase